MALWKKIIFPFNEYVLKANSEFISLGNARAVVIHQNIGDEELYSLLGKINGVLFPGGAIKLINNDTLEEHSYYTLAKKIINYSMKLKDE